MRARTVSRVALKFCARIFNPPADSVPYCTKGLVATRPFGNAGRMEDEGKRAIERWEGKGRTEGGRRERRGPLTPNPHLDPP